MTVIATSLPCPKCRGALEPAYVVVRLGEGFIRSPRFRCVPCKRLFTHYELKRKREKGK